MSLTLTLRAAEAIDASSITPDALASLATSDIGKLPCWIGRQRVPLGELFSIDGERSDDVRMRGDLRQVNGLGTGMSRGVLTIDGDVGDGAGVAMSGGLLQINGSAGDRLGAPLAGASRGMTGGEIIVRGNVGANAARRVRRGLVVVGGDAGPGAAHAMIAGTILVAGRLGAGAGLWSKRGSVIALGAVEIPATYQYACTYRPSYVPLLLRYLARVRHFATPAQFATGRYKRWTGDVADVGKGEILEWTT
jgi:formylmethanofuran dehydrogenase subunit C